MSDSDFFSMSSNRKDVNEKMNKKNVRFQHFCLKMRAREKRCVTKVAHCTAWFVSDQVGNQNVAFLMMWLNYVHSFICFISIQCFFYILSKYKIVLL